MKLLKIKVLVKNLLKIDVLALLLCINQSSRGAPNLQKLLLQHLSLLIFYNLVRMKIIFLFLLQLFPQNEPNGPYCPTELPHEIDKIEAIEVKKPDLTCLVLHHLYVPTKSHLVDHAIFYLD